MMEGSRLRRGEDTGGAGVFDEASHVFRWEIEVSFSAEVSAVSLFVVNGSPDTDIAGAGFDSLEAFPVFVASVFFMNSGFSNNLARFRARRISHPRRPLKLKRHTRLTS